jgi:hypothetical protein
MNNEIVDRDRKFIKNCYEFLESHDGVTRSVIDSQLISWNDNALTLSDIMFRLIESAQNKQMSPRVIGESIGGIENLKPVLFDRYFSFRC